VNFTGSAAKIPFASMYGLWPQHIATWTKRLGNAPSGRTCTTA
jgi:hypothetical protein